MKKNTIISLTNTKHQAINVWQTTSKKNSITVQTKQSDTHQQTENLYDEFNLGLHVKDNALQVHQHRTELLQFIQNDCPNIQQIHWLNQIHGNEVIEIKRGELYTQPSNADAHFTQDSNIALAIMSADCVPIVLASPKTADGESEYIAAIHAGWQGLAKGIIAHTIVAIQQAIKQNNKKFPSESLAIGHWQAWIGACIAQEHYEVDERVRTQILRSLQPPISELLAENFFTPQPQKLGHYLANLPLIAAYQLQQCGIKEKNIHQSKLDSYSDSRFYSYRRQSEQRLAFTGRMATIIFKG